MENPRGRVLAVDLRQPVPSAEVEVAAAMSCARCASGKGCGAGLLGSNVSSRRVDAQIGNGIAVSEGDEVRIALAPRNLLRASLLVYGAPLGGALLAAAIAYFAALGDLLAALAALAGVIAGLAFARLRLRATTCLREFTPTIIERLTVDH